MSSAFLILPLLLPVAAAFLARRKTEKRLLIALMAAEFVLVLLGCFCQGGVSLRCLPEMSLMLTADGIGCIFSGHVPARGHLRI